MSEIKVNDYIVARYNGESGDVIAGQVVKIRAGKAYMKNLLTGGDSERAVDIVNRRNITASRKDALRVAEIYHETEDKQKARKAAVEIANRIKQEAEKTEAKEKAVDKSVTALDKTQPKVKTEEAPKRRGRPPKVATDAAPKVGKAKATKAKTNGNGHVDVHVKISKGHKVLVERVFKVKE